METSQFTVAISNKHIPVHIDTHGNLYLELDKKLYQLNIDKNNDPYLDGGDYSVITTETFEKPNVGEILPRSDDAPHVNNKYFPEDAQYQMKTTYEYHDEMDDVSHFVFHKKCVNFNEICERENGDIDALYDTYIYDNMKDPDGKQHTQLVFLSKLCDEVCAYRTILYTNGNFYFRAIGCVVEKKYKIIIDDNNIMIVHV